MAALSVHSPGRGTRTTIPAAAQRSSASARSREFAATPPPISASHRAFLGDTVFVIMQASMPCG